VLLPAPAPTAGLTEAQARLRGMVVDAVSSPHSRRNYAKALDDLFAFAAGQALTRALLLEWRVSMAALAPSIVNVRLSAVRKLVSEAHKSGLLNAEETEHLRDIPNLRQKGSRMGHWLAKEILAVPDRSVDAEVQARMRHPGAVKVWRKWPDAHSKWLISRYAR
jgi:hypothetical protein